MCFTDSIGIIIGVVVGVSVLACVISILVPLLICCCLGVACFASIGCLAKNKKYDEAELKGVKLCLYFYSSTESGTSV